MAATLDEVKADTAQIIADLETETTGLAAKVTAIKADIDTATTGMAARVVAIQATLAASVPVIWEAPPNYTTLASLCAS